MSNLQDSEAEAFARLYTQHSRAIAAYVTRRVGPAAAEEVTAEVFLVAWRRLRLHRARRRLDTAMRAADRHPDPTMERSR